MKRKNKIIIIMIIISAFICLISIWIISQTIINNTISKDNMKVSMRAVVIREMGNYLLVMQIDEYNNLLYIKNIYLEDNIDFKQGQEILIYYNGVVLDSYPGIITDVGRIEIIKTKSDIEIPEIILEHAYELKQ